MNWSTEAEEAVAKIPFFVRRRVKKRVEEEAARTSSATVEMRHVIAGKKRFMESMEKEVRGHQLENCFGPGGCPNRAVHADDLMKHLDKLLSEKALLKFLKGIVDGPLKLHHEFRVTIAECPNACSRPQIADLGIIGAARPVVTDEECSRCLECVEACKEGAVSLAHDADYPLIDYGRCVLCGHCVDVCPTGTIAREADGYRIQLGGKLGRHPQLATEISGIHSELGTVEIVERCVSHYKMNNNNGERFGEILNRTGLGFLNPCRVTSTED
ncbi:4Fe-4S dicluster domain-containing protein [Thermodesulfobacteriota bacterium]